MIIESLECFKLQQMTDAVAELKEALYDARLRGVPERLASGFASVFLFGWRDEALAQPVARGGL